MAATKEKADTKTPAVKEEKAAQVQQIIPNEPMKVESAMDSFLNPALFSQLQRGAALLASSKLVPDHFRNDVPSCFIALELAARMKMDPIMLMQRTYVVHGKPGFEAQFVISLVNTSGRFRDPLDWELSGEGKTRKAVCFTHRHDGRRVQAEVTMAMADAEGWTKKKDTKWLTLPDQMLMYRSAAFFGRLHCPEVMMGMNTIDELDDIGPTDNLAFKPTTRVINPEDDVSVQKTEEVASKLRSKREKTAPEAATSHVSGVCDKTATEVTTEAENAHEAKSGGDLPVFTEGELNAMPVSEVREYTISYAAALDINEKELESRAGCDSKQWTKPKCKELLLAMGYTF